MFIYMRKASRQSLDNQFARQHRVLKVKRANAKAKAKSWFTGLRVYGFMGSRVYGFKS
jgi:hypothetical protein